MKQINTLRSRAALAGAAFCLIPAMFALQACGSKGQNDLSRVKHDAGHPTRSNEGWNWVATTPAQYKSVLAPLVQIDTSTLLAADHKLTKRVQLWLDKVDASLRSAYPDALASVPKPQAMITVDATANAFVAPAAVCYKVAVKVKNGNATANTTRDKVFLDAKTGELSDFPNDLSCIDGPAGPGNLKTFAQQFNAASTACKFEVQGSDAAAKLVPNASCHVADDLGDTVLGKSIVILQTANWVTVHTGIFSLLDEDSFVAVLSHELGHYYRSHMTAHASNFGFYYTLDQTNPDHRPVADASVKGDGEKAFAAATLLSDNDYYTPMTGQKTRSELFMAVGSLIKTVAGAGSGVPAECITANDLLKSSSFGAAIDKFPFAKNDADMDAAYANFESKVGACLAKLTVKASGAVTATGASWAAFKDLVTKPVWPTWIAQLPSGSAQAIGALLDTIGSRLGAAPATGTTWDKVLAAKSTALVAQDAAGILALRSAHDQKIGQYTIEQEADEESAEWIAKLGFDPKASVSAMHALVMGEETSLHGLLLGQADCEALYDRDWTDAQGSYQFVPVGDYSEIHHSTCYRMFNLSREILAHHEVSSGAALPPHGGQDWKDLQTLADHESGGGNPADPGGHGPLGFSHHKVAPIALKSHAFDCVYASQYR